MGWWWVGRSLPQLDGQLALAGLGAPVTITRDDLGVPAIELHTGEYAHHWREGPAALDQLRRAASHAAELGLAVHAGHGLTYLNVGEVAAGPEIEELNIGHSIVSRAVFEGLEGAVRRMRRLMSDARAGSGRP